MAVTIHTSPQLYTPSDSPIVWTFSSNQTAQANFSYIVDLYIGGALDSRHQIFPESGIYAHFDASETMQSRCASANLNVTTFVRDADNYESCYIVVNEYYGTTPALQANATSSTIYPFKAYVSDDDIATWDYTDYLIGSSTSKFLTDFDRGSFRMIFQGTQFLQIITNLTATTLRLRYYDSSDTLTVTETQAIGNTIRIAQICLNPSDFMPSFVGSSYVIVDIYDGSIKSESITINIDVANDCDIYIPVTWLNSLGAYDSWVFNFNKTESSDIQAFSYKRQLGRWSGSTFVLDASVSGTNEYFKTIQDRGQIVSGWLTQAQQTSIVKLYESPYVTMELSKLIFTNFTVVNSSYDLKQSRFEDLFNEVVEYRLSNNRKSPRL